MSVEAEKNRRKDLLVAEIRAAGMGSMVDLDKNNQNDFADAMEKIRKSEEFQQTMDLQSNKEQNRQDLDGHKMDLENRKLDTQIQMKNTDLQIAQENVNKYDVNQKIKEQKQTKVKKKK
jgi:hypothetical protein